MKNQLNIIVYGRLYWPEAYFVEAESLSKVVSELIEKVNQMNETIKALTGKILVIYKLSSDKNRIF